MPEPPPGFVLDGAKPAGAAPAPAAPVARRRNDAMGTPPRLDKPTTTGDLLNLLQQPGMPLRGEASPLGDLIPEKPQSVAGGVGFGLAETAEGLSSPLNMLLMVGGGGLGQSLVGASKVARLLPRLVSGGFSLQMLGDAVREIPEVRDAWQRGDHPAVAQNLTKLLLTGGMGVAAGAHAVRGTKATAGEPKAETVTPIRETKAAGAETVPEPPPGFVMEPSVARPAAQVIEMPKRAPVARDATSQASDTQIARAKDAAAASFETQAAQDATDELQKRHPDVNFRRVVFKGDGYYIQPDAAGKVESGPFPHESAAIDTLLAEKGGTPAGRVIDAMATPAEEPRAEPQKEATPLDQAGAFRLSGKALADVLERGNEADRAVAQAEMDRRKAKRTALVEQPKPAAEPEAVEQPAPEAANAAEPVKPEPQPEAKAPEPAAASTSEKLIAKASSAALRKAADALESPIQAKRNPAIANQNPTARRARIAAGMANEADRLERIQKGMRALADLHDAGEVPPILSKIRSRAAFEDAMPRYDERGKRVDTRFPSPFLRPGAARDILEKIKGYPGLKEARRILENAQYASDGLRIAKHQIGPIEEAMAAAAKRGWSDKYVAGNFANVKRLYAAGIDETNFKQAEDAIEALGVKRREKTAEDKIREAERELIGMDIEGFFPTPKPVVSRLLQEADIQPGMKVLEPSAGNGAIADELRKAGGDVTTIERAPRLRSILELKGHSVGDSDFLEHAGQYDRIVMNPPFERGQDITHVRHAYDQLSPGGRVVAIMSEGPFFRNDAKAASFREWLDEVGGRSEKLPGGSFTGKDAMRQTGVATRMVVIDKPAGSAPGKTKRETAKQESKPAVDTTASAPTGFTTATGEVQPRQPKTAPAHGRETSIAIPGETTKYPARYSVRELADVQPSHNAQSFEPNPAYEHVNDRDYKSNTAIAQGVVDRAAPGKFDPDFLTTDNPTAEHGAPVIDERGNVLGGNSRTMTISRVYDRGGAEADAYRQAIAKKAASFGLNPDEILAMKRPVLVREATGKLDAQKAITDFNKGAPAKLAPEEQAVADGRRLGPKTVAELGARLGDLGESATMAEALRGDNGAEVLNLLERDGVVTAQEKGGLVDDRGNLTPEAKARIGKALVGRLFETAAEFRETPPAMRGKLERIAPQILRVEGRKGWDLTERVREALALAEDARVHRMTPEETARQNVIGATRRYHPEAIRLAEVLSENPRHAEHAFKRYANDEALSREGAQAAFFEPPTREEAFKDAFGEVAAPAAKADVPMRDLEEQIAEVRKRAIEEQASKAKRIGGFGYRGGSAKERGAVSLRGRRVDATSLETEMRALAEKARRAYEGSPVEAGVAFLKPLGQRVAAEGAGAGQTLMRMIQRAGDKGEVRAGQLLVRLADARITRLDRGQRFELLDALEGRKQAPKSGPVREAFDAMRGVTDELGAEATARGVEVRTKNGKRPFAAIEDYFPHILRGPDALKRGAVRRDIVENLVRQKVRPDKASAEAFLNDWVDYLESGKRQESLLAYIVDSGQAKNAAEALAKLQKFRSNIERHGSLEFARELNLPFYDPDPVRVLPYTAATSAKRLAQIAEFGQDHQKINQEILKISLAGGNADFARKSVDRMLGVINDGNTAEVRVSRFLRGLSTLRLSLAAIPNSTQSLNALLAGDLPSFAAGLRAAMTEKGRRFAVESGASIEPVLAEAQRELGGGRLIERYLKGTGFTATERFNRAVSANAGARYAKRLLAAKDERKLAELGIDAAAAIGRGSLTETELLMAAKKFSDLTQFRTRPEDLPGFATTPMGKAVFQFKAFAYQQARFMAKETLGEFRSGRAGKGLRNLMLVAALYPAAGEAVRALRNGISGREDEFDTAMERYWNDVAQAGTLGIFADAIEAAERNKTTEFLAGPAAGQVTDFARMMRTLADPDADAEERVDAIQRYALTRFGSGTRRLLEDR